MVTPSRPQSPRDVPSGESPVGLTADSLREMLSLGRGGEFPVLAPPGEKAASGVQLFGEYEVLEKVAHGGMGVVYKARHVPLNRVVALKMILGGQFAGPAQVARFRREAEAAARLLHPNIVPIYGVGEHAGWHYLTMPFLEGGNLARAAARERFSPASAAAVMATVAAAVDHAHRNGVLHRDLKPNNILLDDAGAPHVTDFGLARLLEEDECLTRTAAVMGTPAYMAPEQACAKAAAQRPAADVYSLGAILYELLTGRPPFAEATPVETLRRAIQEPPPRPRGLDRRIDKDLETICLKCLEKDPAHRYASAAALAEDLERWRRREPVAARPAGRLLRTRRWARRNPAIAVLLVALSVALVAALWVARAVDRQSQQKARLLVLVGDAIGKELTELWKDDRREYLPISIEKLAVLAGTGAIPDPDSADALPLVVAVHDNDNEKPAATAEAYARLLLYLQGAMAQELGRPVRPELRLYKHNRHARADMLKGEVHLMRMGAHSYLLARDKDPQLEPLVREKTPGGKMIVFFTRPDTGIRTLADLKGRSVAAGDVTSTTSGFWGPVHLYRARITLADLKAYEFNSVHGTAMKAVDGRFFDAGVTGLNSFTRKPRQGLVRLTVAGGGSATWVGRRGQATDVAASFRKSMTSLRDDSILRLLGEATEGFEPCGQEDFEEMHRARPERKAFFGGRDPLEATDE